jgi:hypothetical protein
MRCSAAAPQPLHPAGGDGPRAGGPGGRPSGGHALCAGGGRAAAAAHAAALRAPGGPVRRAIRPQAPAAAAAARLPGGGGAGWGAACFAGLASCRGTADGQLDGPRGGCCCQTSSHCPNSLPQGGLAKLAEAEAAVDVLGQEAEVQRGALRTKQAEADQALADISASMQVGEGEGWGWQGLGRSGTSQRLRCAGRGETPSGCLWLLDFADHACGAWSGVANVAMRTVLLQAASDRRREVEELTQKLQREEQELTQRRGEQGAGGWGWRAAAHRAADGAPLVGVLAGQRLSWCGLPWRLSEPCARATLPAAQAPWRSSWLMCSR